MHEKSKPRIVSWDIETTNLNANYGYLLCCGFKVLGEKRAKVISIADRPVKGQLTNDCELVKAIASELAKADVWVTWYGSKFDAPFVNSRLLYHGLPALPPVRHVDCWRIARHKLKLNSNRLASVSAFLGLNEKTPLSGPLWIKAMAGDRKALKYIVKHCEVDCIVLEEAYERLRGLAPAHPNIALTMRDGVRRCPTCASTRLESKGYTASATQIYQRFVCRDCGAYSRRTKTSGGVEVR